MHRLVHRIVSFQARFVPGAGRPQSGESWSRLSWSSWERARLIRYRCGRAEVAAFSRDHAVCADGLQFAALETGELRRFGGFTQVACLFSAISSFGLSSSFACLNVIFF